MTRQEYVDIYNHFKNTYNGKYIDIDNAYGGQCWDLAQMYFSRFLGIPESLLGGIGLVSGMLYGSKREYLNQYFEEYDSYKTIILPGDVAIWEYGHIALVDSWNGKEILYFSQNPNPCQVMPIRAGGLHLFRRKGLVDNKPITLPTTHTVISGDTVAKLCLKYYGVADKEHFDFIKRVNGLNDSYVIVIDQQLTIPIYETPKPIETPIEPPKEEPIQEDKDKPIEIIEPIKTDYLNIFIKRLIEFIKKLIGGRK